MKTQSLLPLGLFVVGLTQLASNSPSNTFDKITVHEFELTDAKGTKRATIKVEPTGEVVFRLISEKGTIRVKLGASEVGSGFVLLDDNTDPGVHAHANKDGSGITITGKDKKKREY
jgi:hypothetical protein